MMIEIKIPFSSVGKTGDGAVIKNKRVKIYNRHSAWFILGGILAPMNITEFCLESSQFLNVTYITQE